MFKLLRTIKPNSTAEFQHSRNMGHTFKYYNTKILASERNLQKRLTLEAINIWCFSFTSKGKRKTPINTHRKTAVNINSDIDSLNPAYTQLLNKKLPYKYKQPIISNYL